MQSCPSIVLPPQPPSLLSTLSPTAETVGVKGQGETQDRGLGRTEAGPRGEGDEGQALGTCRPMAMLSCSQSHMPNISFSSGILRTPKPGTCGALA